MSIDNIEPIIARLERFKTRIKESKKEDLRELVGLHFFRCCLSEPRLAEELKRRLNYFLQLADNHEFIKLEKGAIQAAIKLAKAITTFSSEYAENGESNKYSWRFQSRNYSDDETERIFLNTSPKDTTCSIEQSMEFYIEDKYYFRIAQIKGDEAYRLTGSGKSVGYPNCAHLLNQYESLYSFVQSFPETPIYERAKKKLGKDERKHDKVFEYIVPEFWVLIPFIDEIRLKVVTEPTALRRRDFQEVFNIGASYDHRISGHVEMRSQEEMTKYLASQDPQEIERQRTSALIVCDELLDFSLSLTQENKQSYERLIDTRFFEGIAKDEIWLQCGDCQLSEKLSLIRGPMKELSVEAVLKKDRAKFRSGLKVLLPLAKPTTVGILGHGNFASMIGVDKNSIRTYLNYGRWLLKQVGSRFTLSDGRAETAIALQKTTSNTPTSERDIGEEQIEIG
ncbi:MAG: hypothetical protein PHZ00_01245 [Candidatus Peribacteraceae bacterium]|nr:hypothetical protein [Candidatus Peribacteraceae bacterium]